MERPETGNEDKAIKPATLAQCHAVIKALNAQIDQLREQMNEFQ